MSDLDQDTELMAGLACIIPACFLLSFIRMHTYYSVRAMDDGHKFVCLCVSCPLGLQVLCGVKGRRRPLHALHTSCNAM